LQRDEDYSNALKEVSQFSTVEDFWRHWSYLPRPSEVFGDGNGKKIVDGRSIKSFSLFKKGIKPTWEDPLNAAGSELTTIRAFNLEVLDVLWENLILALVGEVIEDSDEVCGVRVVDQMKKAKVSYKLELWLKTQDDAVCNKIRTKLIDVLMEGEAAKPGSRIRVPEFDLTKRGKGGS
jgi:translation initiation factor 4E